MEATTAPPTEETGAITVHLTPEEDQILQDLAAARGLSAEVLLREALVEKHFFTEHRQRGNNVVLQHPDGKLSPVNWSYPV